ncbi:nicotinate phosphoribosyltransferase [Roseivirga sp. BDSF3-8]|uniref:nicotinate phosphoribosyltransferase n=1 Tax=Roseivirga sp. BDSF3-8 TaxID=3241598 RepID=UPI0035325C2C
MKITHDLYTSSMALLTDLYQVTMAHSYWKAGLAEQRSVFTLFFRQNPFSGGYTINCGLDYIIDFIKSFRFSDDDIDYLRTIKASSGKPMFSEPFLAYLHDLRFNCDIDAAPEGTVLFPHEPMLRVEGPVVQAQLLETALLNILNFQSLIATKSARICQAAKGDPVMEFGLRRAQGIDGAIAASRAAYIGGCHSTSNILAGKLFDIPVSGTHAHSWVMMFEDEKEAFRRYAESMPDNCVFLVDTYDTEQGVRHAIEVAREMEEKGQRALGIRIDSGDLAYFSIMARRMLDEAGLGYMKIVASNDLDEHIIESLKIQGAAIDIWGVGTKLVTAFDQPALGAVYKLSAVEKDGIWEPRIKLSEQQIKINNPGRQQILRFVQDGQYFADAIFDPDREHTTKVSIIDPLDPTRRKKLSLQEYETEEVMIPIFRNGQCMYDSPSSGEIRNRVATQLGKLHSGVKRFINPHRYPVGLEANYYKVKTDLILKMRNLKES